MRAAPGKAALLVCLGLALGLAASLYQTEIGALLGMGRIEIDATVFEPDKAVFTATVNGPRGAGQAATIASGGRRTLVFTLGTPEVSSLHLTFGHGLRTLVKLHAIRVYSGTRAAAGLGPADLGRAVKSDIAALTPDSDGVLIETGRLDPSLAIEFSPPADSGAGAGQALARFVLACQVAAPGAGWLVLASPLMLLALGLGDPFYRRLCLAVAALAALTGLLVALIDHLPRHYVADVARSLGAASYFGDTPVYQKYMPFGLAMCAALAAIAAFGRRSGQVPAAGDEPAPDRPGSLDIVLVLLLAVLFVSSRLFDAGQTLADITTGGFAFNWDNANLALWSYLHQTGETVYRDFWYPYAGRLLFSSTFPLGELAAFGVATLFAVTLLASTVRLAGGRRFGLLVIPLLSLSPWFGERYMFIPAVLAAAAGLAVIPADRLMLALFWAGFTVAVIIEPVSLVYLGAPVAIAGLAYAVFVEHGLRPAGYSVWLLRLFGVPTLALAVIAGALVARGQFDGFMVFMGSVKELANSALLATHYHGWLTFDPVVEGVVFWSGPLFLTLGLGGLIAGRKRTAWLDMLMTLTALAIVMLDLKQFTRAHIAVQILPLCHFGLAVFLARSVLSGNAAQRVLAGFVAAAAIACAPDGGFAARGLLDLHTLPHRIEGAVSHTLATGEAESAAIVRAQYAPGRFATCCAGYLDLAAGIKDRITPGTPSLFVLGDSPILYILTQTKPPYVPNLYDAASLTMQRRVADWLHGNKPPLVAMNLGGKDLDNVPWILRDPLILEQVISSYVLDSYSGDFAILALKPAGPEDVEATLDFWTDKLGKGIDLGFIPAASRLLDHVVGSGQPGHEARLLTVTLDPALGAAAPKRVTIDASGAGRRFELSFSTRPGQASYTVNLDRIWFYKYLRDHDRPVDLQAAGQGLEVTVREAVLDGDYLF